MKLNVDALRYLSRDDFTVLTAVEKGMCNAEMIVPVHLIDRIAALKHGGTHKILRNLLRHKLLHHDSSKGDGYRLTYMGFDFLALKEMVDRGVFATVGRKIGTGKESDIFEVFTEDGTVLAMKLHRLGRVSFRAVKAKRDYHKRCTSHSWLSLSSLAARKEFLFMKALEDHGFPVPCAVDRNRHCVVMSLVDGYQLGQVKELANPEVVFKSVIGLIVRLAEHGLIHCDYNEFNIMIGDDEKITMIDFPQMVSVKHYNAEMYFDRDIDCIDKFFSKRFNVSFEEDSDEQDDSDGVVRPSFADIKMGRIPLDREVAASGFTREDQADIKKEEDDHSGQLSTSIEEREIENEASEGEARTASDEDEDEDEDGDEDEELMKSLSQQRRRVIHAARRRKTVTSRNCNKDKGRKSSHNSKILA